MTKVEEVIITDLNTKGNGRNKLFPVRSILEVYQKNGELLATFDRLGNFSIEDMIDFATYCKNHPEMSIDDSYQQWRIG